MQPAPAGGARVTRHDGKLAPSGGGRSAADIARLEDDRFSTTWTCECRHVNVFSSNVEPLDPQLRDPDRDVVLPWHCAGLVLPTRLDGVDVPAAQIDAWASQFIGLGGEAPCRARQASLMTATQPS